MSFVKRLEKELHFLVSRSSGPGGQNVNKVNSKVTLKFNVMKSLTLTDEEKELILKKLETKLTNDHVLILSSQQGRSQLDNKEIVLFKFEKLLAKVFEKEKIRKATKPSKVANRKRLESKKQHAEKKKWRQKLP